MECTSDLSRQEWSEIEAVVAGRHGDPFSFLGFQFHTFGCVIRAFLPGAQVVRAETLDGETVSELQLVHPAGFFRSIVDRADQPRLRYIATAEGATWSISDPYCFRPVLGEVDDYLIAEGTHLHLYDRLGSHVLVHEGVSGVHFAVWAPNASRVSVVGDFNSWDGRRHPMHKRATGVWEIFLPEIGEGARYKYELVSDSAVLPLKADPLAFAAELRPRTASIVSCTENFKWTDAAYLQQRARSDPRLGPISIYEVHAGSWRRHDGKFYSYADLADTLVPYVKSMGFTHIEFLPISEHPYDPSWGYQPTGLFAPTARFGNPADFALLVDAAHAAGIGIILDWVPAHFPHDSFGLARFDGTALYEHEDPKKGFHPDWNTAIYNFGRTEVQNFLIANALFWFERYHIDGLRVDAVASMLYLDYSRKDGEWLPNQFGGNENLEAIAFLKRMNELCYKRHPGIFTIAEESTAFPGVSHPTSNGGLGFGFKWNMGFMHDTLKYLAKDPVHRKHHHHDLTFGLLYAFTENFVLPLSHDEVVHGKGSLLKKMSGDDWQQFANLRAYLALMWAYPGKKLLFMGQEFASRTEWSESGELDWRLLDHEPHRGMQQLVRDINQFYSMSAALHASDCIREGFSWLISDDEENSVFAWLRTWKSRAAPVAVIANLTPIVRYDYRVPLPFAGVWSEVINTDALAYCGSGIGNRGHVLAHSEGSSGVSASALVTLPPLATLILEFKGYSSS